MSAVPRSCFRLLLSFSFGFCGRLRTTMLWFDGVNLRDGYLGSSVCEDVVTRGLGPGDGRLGGYLLLKGVQFVGDRNVQDVDAYGAENQGWTG